MDNDIVAFLAPAISARSRVKGSTACPRGLAIDTAPNDRRMADDWRREIHDSDGLAIWTGTGGRIWRPLLNPAVVRVNSYIDDDLRGFGLQQRNRDVDHYQDDGAYYDRRPSAWIEPKAHGTRGWGKGAVQLVEIPTATETFDNIVAFWSPAQKPQPGQELLVSYRIHRGGAPLDPPLGQVVATRNGVGSTVGQKRKHFSWRFTIDFVGGQLATLGKSTKVEVVVTASRGAIELPLAQPQAQIQGYRALFDLRPTQWTPPPAAERRQRLTQASPDPGSSLFG